MKTTYEGVVVGLSKTYRRYKAAGESDSTAVKFVELAVELPGLVTVPDDPSEREEPYVIHSKFPPSQFAEAKELVGKKVRVTRVIEEVE